MTRPHFDLNPIEPNYYPFIIRLDKCDGRCNADDDLSTKIYVPSETKEVNVKVSNMTTRINEAKTSVKHIPCDCKYKFDSTTYNSNQKSNSDKCQCECKNRHTHKKDYSWNPSTCICENGKCLKSVNDTSVIVHDEIINATDSVSTNATKIIPTNATNTVSINSDDKKIRYKMDCYIWTLFY